MLLEEYLKQKFKEKKHKFRIVYKNSEFGIIKIYF